MPPGNWSLPARAFLLPSPAREVPPVVVPFPLVNQSLLPPSGSCHRLTGTCLRFIATCGRHHLVCQLLHTRCLISRHACLDTISGRLDATGSRHDLRSPCRNKTGVRRSSSAGCRRPTGACQAASGSLAKDRAFACGSQGLERLATLAITQNPGFSPGFSFLITYYL